MVSNKEKNMCELYKKDWHMKHDKEYLVKDLTI